MLSPKIAAAILIGGAAFTPFMVKAPDPKKKTQDKAKEHETSGLGYFMRPVNVGRKLAEQMTSTRAVIAGILLTLAALYGLSLL